MTDIFRGTEELKNLQVESLGDVISRAIKAIAAMVQRRKNQALDSKAPTNKPFEITTIDLLAEAI